MKNKKAWLKIVEAFLAVLIMLSIVIFLIPKQKTDDNTSVNINKKQMEILDIISKNDSLREKIIAGENKEVNETISKMIPGNWNFATKICNINEICNTDTPNDREVYSDEILVTSTLTKYGPKKLKFFVWVK